MKYVGAVIIFVVSLLIFVILEYGQIKISIKELLQPVVFASTVLAIFLNVKLRQSILWISVVLISLMVILYFFNLLPSANWVGSLGIGILVILILSYFPNLIKDGHI